MEKLSFKVAELDAPLDLILRLISRHKLDIVDIDISSLLEQYVDTISLWQGQDLEISSEFLEMASRLVYIKTVSLLPRHEEETEQLRRELTGQLVEYRLCRLAAQRLGELNRYGAAFVRPPERQETDEPYALTHSADVLCTALADAMGKGARRRPPAAETFEPLVTRPVVSVTGKIFAVLRTLRIGGAVKMDKLFTPENSRSGMVAIFLAVLELIKSGKVRLEHNKLRLAARPESPSRRQKEDTFATA